MEKQTETLKAGIHSGSIIFLHEFKNCAEAGDKKDLDWN